MSACSWKVFIPVSLAWVFSVSGTLISIMTVCLTVCLCGAATNDSNINAIFGKPATPNGQNASRGSSDPIGGQNAFRGSSGPKDSAFSGDFGGEAS